MEELEFSNRFLGDYVIRGDEIIPEFCPFCHGGEHRDRRTFALNKRDHVTEADALMNCCAYLMSQ